MTGKKHFVHYVLDSNHFTNWEPPSQPSLGDWTKQQCPFKLQGYDDQND